MGSARQSVIANADRPARHAVQGDHHLTDDDLHFFNEGTHMHLYEKMGAHPHGRGKGAGTNFAVWAPNAEHVSVIGDFNGWDWQRNRLEPRGSSGIWEGVVQGAGVGSVYKYHIVSRHNGYRVDKADPFAFRAEVPPRTGSIVSDLSYEWSDADWLRTRRERQSLDSPMSVYEVHLGSWRRSPDDPEKFLSYRQIAPQLAEYVSRMGFTHVELLPIMEHPFYGSWGYQATGYFAATSRFGQPQDLMYLIDVLHQHGIGVILDWAPAHFPSDEHGLAYFDGTHLYEHDDPRQRIHPDWQSYVFNYGRNEVRSFLLSSAMFWLDKYHIDGLRVDAVASMLYLDFSRKEGEWVPNRFGRRENNEAIDFLRQFNAAVYERSPHGSGVQTIAEESTAWPMVSRPTYVGGLGFGYKWDMGWMHDTLSYFKHDPVHRSFHHSNLTFRQLYAFTENFVLPLSHDEVVHLKGSLLNKMPGDPWQKFANLRLLLTYMWTQPGKKMLFMGGEFGQWEEWNHDKSLDWHLLDHEPHEGVRRTVERLNFLLREEHALHELDVEPSGFEWIDCCDTANSIVSYLRKSRQPGAELVVVLNFTPVPRHNYQIGVPHGGYWEELFNSDAREYGGSGQGNFGGVQAAPISRHGRSHSITLTLPPLAGVILKASGGDDAA